MRAISEKKIVLKVSIIVVVIFFVVGVGVLLYGQSLFGPPFTFYWVIVLGQNIIFLAVIGGLVIGISYLVMQGLGIPIGIIFMVMGGFLLLMCFLQGSYAIYALSFWIIPIIPLLVIGLVLVIVNPKKKKELNSKNNHRDGTK